MTKCVATAVTRNSGSSGRSRDTVWSMTASSSEGANSAYIVIYSPKTPPVLSRVRSPGRPYHGRCRIDTKDQIGNEQDESSTKGQPAGAAGIIVRVQPFPRLHVSAAFPQRSGSFAV